ncbi:MAG: glycosyltransferase, partial [Raineya sp.]
MLSIIIINYNTFSLTCKCIESILQYTQGVSYEIILVDNASTECDADKFLEFFPQITLIKSPENVGFARGNNLGLQYAKGEYILL